MQIVVRTLESDRSAEIYVTVTPTAGLPPDEQARDVFSAISSALRSQRACILQERVFAAASLMERLAAGRATCYGDLDDGVAPTFLAVPEGARGQFPGVQVHAVRCPEVPPPVRPADAAEARVFTPGGRGFITLSGVSAPGAGTAPQQARAMFEQAERLLHQAGTDMRSVARTWIWLDDILAWYDEFNDVRSRFYLEHGLVDRDPAGTRLPASTGIGVSPADGAACALDLVAVTGPEASIRLFGAAGKQKSPYAYGSAFSRAARATTPAGETVFISGTAAIDDSGRTRHIGDVKGQIAMTVDNVRAALREMNCEDEDVVQALVYCVTPEVETAFLEGWNDLPWPHFTLIADICRPDLLFEIEATACPKARRI